MEQLTKWAFREKLQLILEKKGIKAEYDFAEDALNLEGGHKAYIENFYRLYLQGKSLEDITELVFTAPEEVKQVSEAPQAPPAQAPTSQSPTQPPTGTK